MLLELYLNYMIMSLVWILFGLWCFFFVIFSVVVFDMDIVEYNVICYLVNFYNFIFFVEKLS